MLLLLVLKTNRVQLSASKLKAIMKYILLTLLLTCCLLSGCTIPESLKGFDSEAWIGDRMGCNGVRAEMVYELDSLRKDFYDKKEYVVREVLGKPDHEELMERSQRIYIYYIEPGTQCTGRGEMSDANRVEVRINSLAKVSEITYKEPLKTRTPE